MYFRNRFNRCSVRCPEKEGTGVRAMPEQGGTGVTQVPERGGTGIRRLGGLLVLACFALPVTGLHAEVDTWSVSGELSGKVQMSVDGDQRMHLSFLHATDDGHVQHISAVGSLKGDFARLDLYLVDVEGQDASLVPFGSMELILDDCAAVGEMLVKSEADGSGGKSEADGSGGKSEADGSGGKDLSSFAFTLERSTSSCTGKSEADGSGTP